MIFESCVKNESPRTDSKAKKLYFKNRISKPQGIFRFVVLQRMFDYSKNFMNILKFYGMEIF